MSAITAIEIREMSNMLKSFFEREYMDKIYPVGAIYISTSSADPSILFGGTWERIKDRFLLSAGNDYSAGTTGGSPDAVVVSHKHNVMIGGDNVSRRKNSSETGAGFYVPSTINESAQNDYWGSGLDMSSNYKWQTAAVGENEKNKNMPPYLTVYMWKRTA